MHERRALGWRVVEPDDKFMTNSSINLALGLQEHQRRPLDKDGVNWTGGENNSVSLYLTAIYEWGRKVYKTD